MKYRIMTQIKGSDSRNKYAENDRIYMSTMTYQEQGQ